MARMLVVDDSEDDRLFERSLLEDEGHELYFAGDGRQALERYRSHEIDLVVTDLHMPNLNGLRLVQELRELDPEAVIIAVSGVAKDQLDRAADYGAAHTLFESLDPRRFLETVRSALDREPEGDPWGLRDR